MAPTQPTQPASVAGFCKDHILRLCGIFNPADQVAGLGRDSGPVTILPVTLCQLPQMSMVLLMYTQKRQKRHPGHTGKTWPF